MSSAAYTTLDLVRHGQIATRGLLCAGANEPLSSIGTAQMEPLESGIQWDIIVSSPYVRCSGFAGELARKQALPITIDSAWQEIDFGTWTDIKRESIWATDQQRLLQLWSDPLKFTAPGGESMADFVARIHAAFENLLQVHQGKSILVLTHAGVIRAILALALSYFARHL